MKHLFHSLLCHICRNAICKEKLLLLKQYFSSAQCELAAGIAGVIPVAVDRCRHRVSTITATAGASSKSVIFKRIELSSLPESHLCIVSGGKKKWQLHLKGRALIAHRYATAMQSKDYTSIGPRWTEGNISSQAKSTIKVSLARRQTEMHQTMNTLFCFVLCICSLNLITICCVWKENLVQTHLMLYIWETVM